METELGVVYKIADRASEIGRTRFRMPRNIYSWLYGFAHLSCYSRGRINIEFPEDAEEVEKQLRKLCAFFLACKTPPYRIKREIEGIIRENRYKFLPDITREPATDHDMNIRTIVQTDTYGGADGWDSFLSVTELVKYLSKKAKENGFYYFSNFVFCRENPDGSDPKVKEEIRRSWEDSDFAIIVKNEDFDPPQPGTDDFKVVSANRMVAFYSRLIETASSADKDHTFSDYYYDALIDHEFMCSRLKAVSHLSGLSDSKEAIEGRYNTTLKLYQNMLASNYVHDEEKYAIHYEMDSFIKDEHRAQSAVKQIHDEYSLEDLKQDIADDMRLEMDIKLEKLRLEIEKEYNKKYREDFSGIVRAEMEKLLPDLFKDQEKVDDKSYKVYTTSSYSYQEQLFGSYDTFEEASSAASDFNDYMEQMRGEYCFDMRDYRSAYVVGSKEKI